jgi:pimeloyl-ACP methyl ester carboxylesterase
MAFKDVVVLLPGITGSVLANARGKEIWSPSAGAIWRVITSLGDSIEDGLALDAPGITAPRLIPDTTIVPGLVKIDGYTRIEQYLIAQLGLEKGRNYFAFPYDWRLDNRVNAKRLESQALGWLSAWREQGSKDARLVLVGHSMGGLIARHFLECLGGWSHTRTLITLGTPHRGSLNAVGFLVHGMKKGIGPLGLDLSALLRSYPSVHQLLPIYPCIDTGAGELARVAAAAQAGVLPHVKADAAADARAFHQEIEDAQARNAKDAAYAERGYRLVPVVGIEQPTMQSARVAAGGTVELLRSHGGQDLGGDGTVPRVSATPLELSDAEREVYAADTHGSLQNADGVLAQLKGVSTKPGIDLSSFRAELPTALSLDLESDAVGAGEPLVLRARASEGNPAIHAHLTHVASGRSLPVEALARDRERAGWKVAEFDALEPGTWRVRIEAEGATPVTDLALVVAP